MNWISKFYRLARCNNNVDAVAPEVRWIRMVLKIENSHHSNDTKHKHIQEKEIQDEIQKITSWYLFEDEIVDHHWHGLTELEIHQNLEDKFKTRTTTTS